MSIADAVQRAITAEVTGSAHPDLSPEVLHGYIPEYSVAEICEWLRLSDDWVRRTQLQDKQRADERARARGVPTVE